MASRKPPQVALLDKAPTSLHTGLADYVREQTGYDADVQSVSLAARLTTEYRGSEANRKRRAAARNARVTRAADAAKRKQAKAVERAAALREEAARLEAAAGVKPGTKPRKSRAAKNAEQHATGVEELSPAAKRAAAKAALRVVPEPEPEPDEGVLDEGGADEFVLPANPDEAEFQAGPGGDGAVPVITFDDTGDDPDDDDDF